MADHNDSTNRNADRGSGGGTETRTVAELLDAGDVVMVTTRDGASTLSARPLTVAEVQGPTVRFLVDRNAPWVHAVRNGGPLNVTATDGGHNVWASLSGAGTLLEDRVLVQRLWSKPAGAYFDGPDDPAIAVLQLDVRDGEHWSAPGGGAVGRLVSLAASAVGKGERVNEHGPVRG